MNIFPFRCLQTPVAGEIPCKLRGECLSSEYGALRACRRPLLSCLLLVLAASKLSGQELEPPRSFAQLETNPFATPIATASSENDSGPRLIVNDQQAGESTAFISELPRSEYPPLETRPAKIQEPVFENDLSYALRFEPLGDGKGGQKLKLTIPASVCEIEISQRPRSLPSASPEIREFAGEGQPRGAQQASKFPLNRGLSRRDLPNEHLSSEDWRDAEIAPAENLGESELRRSPTGPMGKFVRNPHFRLPVPGVPLPVRGARPSAGYTSTGFRSISEAHSGVNSGVISGVGQAQLEREQQASAWVSESQMTLARESARESVRESVRESLTERSHSDTAAGFGSANLDLQEPKLIEWSEPIPLPPQPIRMKLTDEFEGR